MGKIPARSTPFLSDGGWYYYAGWSRGYCGPFESKSAASDDYEQNITPEIVRASDEAKPRQDDAST